GVRMGADRPVTWLTDDMMRNGGYLVGSRKYAGEVLHLSNSARSRSPAGAGSAAHLAKGNCSD
ncbi:MAG TPA: hypothetical protein VIJ61_13125, partial [Thermoanaerobaculia bacterium]